MGNWAFQRNDGGRMLHTCLFCIKKAWFNITEILIISVTIQEFKWCATVSSLKNLFHRKKGDIVLSCKASVESLAYPDIILCKLHKSTSSTKLFCLVYQRQHCQLHWLSITIILQRATYWFTHFRPANEPLQTSEDYRWDCSSLLLHNSARRQKNTNGIVHWDSPKQRVWVFVCTLW